MACLTLWAVPAPARVLKSTGLTPATWTRTCTSVGIGSGFDSSSTAITSGGPYSRKITARISRRQLPFRSLPSSR